MKKIRNKRAFVLPKVTVLMSAYNSEKYISTAIKSILKQTYKNFELIIIDDCSSDSTWSIIQTYAKGDSRIVALRNKKNIGGCQTLNKGLQIAKGEYIARADNDDISYHYRLKKQVSFLNTHPDVGIVGGAMEIVDQNDKVTEVRKYHLNDKDIRRYIFRYSPFSHPLIMMRKKVLDTVGYYNKEYAPADDYELYFRIGTISKFANLRDILLKYRVVTNSMTQTLTKKMELGTIKARRKYSSTEHYQMTIFDHLYNFLQYLSIFTFPSKLKIRIFNILRNSKVKNSKNSGKVILITGAGSGLGKLIANELSRSGHITYGTYLSSVIKKSKTTLIRTDITSDKDVSSLVSKIISKENRIDVIVNNAGMTLSGPSLDFTEKEFKKILDTNILGSFRLIKSVFSSGAKPSLIINVTSLNAFLSVPNFGLYSSSKHAMEALGLALRYELAPLTQVVNITPGALLSKNNTKMSHKAVREKFSILNWIIPLTPPIKVAKIIAKLVDKPNLPKRVIIGRDAQLINLIQRLLPDFIFDWVLISIWNKK